MELPTGGKFAFLFVGGTLQRKGIDLLLKHCALSRVDNVSGHKGYGKPNVCWGQTAEREIAALQQDEECAEIIYLVKDLPAEDIPGLYAACDCLVHPYRGEVRSTRSRGDGLRSARRGKRGRGLHCFCNSENAFMVPAQRRPVFPRTVGQAWIRGRRAGAAQMRQASSNRSTLVRWDGAVQSALRAILPGNAQPKLPTIP